MVLVFPQLSQFVARRNFLDDGEYYLIYIYLTTIREKKDTMILKEMIDGRVEREKRGGNDAIVL